MEKARHDSLREDFSAGDCTTHARLVFSRTERKSITIPDLGPTARAAPSLNDRTKRGEASALRSQAVAKGLMVLPWQPLRAYCCTPLRGGSVLHTPFPRMAYLFACSVGTRASCACTRTYARTHAMYLRTSARARRGRVRTHMRVRAYVCE